VATLTIDIKDLPDPFRAAVEEAVKGGDVVIAADGVPAIRLTRVPAETKKPRALGMHPGSMTMRGDFDAYIDVEDFLKGEI
jgi:hypothetical protein